ncbi:hypothetical protein RYR30_002261 [Flavobacterium psychrophilum]|nr:hypothetical protein [Flavobacterium psychrophilum]ELM3672290.1 hypothetical protein [Flavobacterium psychrophilum]ELM3726838.1 hypothetical protein [Flavobacterium psychrophilum]
MKNNETKTLTEARFRKLMDSLPNASERRENGVILNNYTNSKYIDHNFSISYHLKFPKKNVQFNFWFEKNSYLNATESVTISFHNGNEKNKELRLTTVLETSDFNSLEKKLKEILLQYYP